MSDGWIRVALYGGGAMIVVAAVVFSDSPLLRPLTEGPRTQAQREAEAAREASKRAADLRILFIGNSHSEAGSPARRMLECFEHDGHGTKVFWDVRAMGNAHFEDHLKSDWTLRCIDEGGWDFIVLQGQQYSTSGLYSYPIDAALELGERCLNTGAEVVLFPEWRQVGNDDEGRRVHDLHLEIAPRIPARIAPVGLAWDRALAINPDLGLHSPDGNHSSPIGAYLTGCVIYATISGRDPRGLPNLPALLMEDATALLLREVAWETVQSMGARDE